MPCSQQDFATRAGNIFGRLDASVDGNSWGLAGQKLAPSNGVANSGSGAWQSPTASALANKAPRRRAVGVPGAPACFQCRAPQPERSPAFFCDVLHRPLFALTCEHGPFCSNCHRAISRQTLPSCICRSLVDCWREQEWPVPVIFGPALPPNARGSSSTALAEEADSKQQRIATESVPSESHAKALDLGRAVAKDASVGSTSREEEHDTSTSRGIQSSTSNGDSDRNGDKAHLDGRGPLSRDLGACTAKDTKSSASIAQPISASLDERGSSSVDSARASTDSMSVAPRLAPENRVSDPLRVAPEESSQAEISGDWRVSSTGANAPPKSALQDAVHSAVAHRAAKAPTPTPQIFKRRNDGDANRQSKSLRSVTLLEDEAASQGHEQKSQNAGSSKKMPAGGAKMRRITAGASDGESDSID